MDVHHPSMGLGLGLGQGQGQCRLLRWDAEDGPGAGAGPAGSGQKKRFPALSQQQQRRMRGKTSLRPLHALAACKRKESRFVVAVCEPLARTTVHSSEPPRNSILVSSHVIRTNSSMDE